MKNHNWPEYYNYWDNRKDYKIGKIDFIKNTKNHPHRKLFIDFICKSKKIKKILEIGPGEMIEYQTILKKRPDIKYSISDISLLFINNCKEKYPQVNTYRIPIEQLNSIGKNKFDCVYLASVLEHSANVKKAIKNCIDVSKIFHFVFFKWSWSGDLKPKYYPTKNLYSTCFNIWKIIEEINLYASINYASVCMSESGKLIPLKEYSNGKTGKNRDHNYLIIHGEKN